MKGTQGTKKTVALFRPLIIINGVTFDEALPPDFRANFAMAYGFSIAHTFSTGWEIGVLQGEERKNKGHKGEYIVQYPSEKRPYWHNLDVSEYGADKYWILLTIVG